jgi:superfamily I DNA and/or RNA helicase
MHPMISAFPRRIFYAGSLDDGPNVCKPDYGGDLNTNIRGNFRHFQVSYMIFIVFLRWFSLKYVFLTL